MESILQRFKSEGIYIKGCFEGIHFEGILKEGTPSDTQQVESNKKSFESFMLLGEKYAILHLERGVKNVLFKRIFANDTALFWHENSNYFIVCYA